MPARLKKALVAMRVAARRVRVLSDFSRVTDRVDAKCLACGHVWRPTLASALKYGCPACSHAKRYLSEKEVRTKLHGWGLALVGSYLGQLKPLTTKCLKCGSVRKHRRAASVLQGKRRMTRCFPCSRQLMRGEFKHTESEVRQRAKALKLELVGRYRGTARPVKVRCMVCGFRWSPRGGTLLDGHRCRMCYFARRRHDFGVKPAEVETRLKKIDVELVGPYKNARHRVAVRCLKCGYNWSPLASSLFGGRGCPECNRPGGVSEEEVRRLLERRTGWKFPRCRPKWLMGKGVPLELDGYNKRHGVAFEYQGEGHYRPLRGEEKLAYVRRNDRRKSRLCKRHGVLLVVIPYSQKDRVDDIVRRKVDRVLRCQPARARGRRRGLGGLGSLQSK
jgi:hypothetical protein